MNCATSEEKVVCNTVLPAKPDAPLNEDCCGNGCAMCVFDIHEQELAFWRKECEEIERGERTEKASDSEGSNLCPEEYHTFEIVDVTQETSTCFKYKFHLPNQQCLQYNVGQHLIFRWKLPDKVLTRQCTIISEPAVVGHFEVLIKLYPDGAMSQYVRTWSIGDFIEWRGPFGHFAYTPNMHTWIVLLAAGTGIAPMTHVIRKVLDNERDETRLRLIYVCRTYDDILCKLELDAWQDFWNFSVLYVLSRKQPGSGAKSKTRFSDHVLLGRLDETLLKEELQQISSERVRVLICGTRSFNTDMVDAVKRIGLGEKDIFVF